MILRYVKFVSLVAFGASVSAVMDLAHIKAGFANNRIETMKSTAWVSRDCYIFDTYRTQDRRN